MVAPLPPSPGLVFSIHNPDGHVSLLRGGYELRAPGPIGDPTGAGSIMLLPRYFGPSDVLANQV